MNPWIHSKSSAAKFGGAPMDYYEIHMFIDGSKSAYGSVQHRAIMHNSYAAAVIIPAVFGPCIVNADGKDVSTKDIAEQHIIEDTGRLPSIQDWVSKIKIEPWMGPPGGKRRGQRRKKRDSPLDDEE